MAADASTNATLAIEPDSRDNEFIAELVSLLESHGNDEFKRKHAQIPSLLHQLDCLTQRRKQQEENLVVYNDRLSKLQELAHCHKDMLDLSKKLVRWLGNGFSSAEILENVRDVKEKAGLIERIRANAIRGGRERQVREALEKLESLRRKITEGLADLGEGGTGVAEEIENSIQNLMRRERAEVEKTKVNCSRLQNEVQKIDDELSNAEKELQSAISSAYQSAIKQTTGDQVSQHGEAPSMSQIDSNRTRLMNEEDRRRYESALRDHVRSIRDLDIGDGCSEGDAGSLTDDEDQSTSASDDHVIDPLEKPQQCMKPMIISSERDNGKLHLQVDLQSSLSETRPESVSFVVEISLEGYRKSTNVKVNLWKVAIPLPNEDASLQIRTRAVNAIGLGQFSEITSLHVEGVRSRKRRLATQKAEADLVARENEKIRVVELQDEVKALKDAFHDGDLQLINNLSKVTRACVANLTALHSEKKIRASPDAASSLRLARSSIKESEKIEETRKKQSDLLEKVTRLAKETKFDDMNQTALSNTGRSVSEDENTLGEAEVKATAVCLEWQELINEVNEKGASVESVKEVKKHFFKSVVEQAEKCQTPPRALGDVLDLAVLKTNVFGSQVQELKILQASLKKKREAWVRKRDEILTERKTGLTKEDPLKAKKMDKRMAAAQPPQPKPKVDEKTNLLLRKRREGHSRSERRQRAAARKAEHTDIVKGSTSGPKTHPGRLTTPPTSEQGLSPKSVVPISTLSVGKRYRGRVVGIARFGFFVDIGSEKPGLVHISQIREGYISNVHDEVKMLQEVWVRVASLSIEHQNFSCTMRENVDFASATEIFDGPPFEQMQTEMEDETKPKPFSITSGDAWPGLGETQKQSSPKSSSATPNSPHSNRSIANVITPETRMGQAAPYVDFEARTDYLEYPLSASERSPARGGENNYYSPFPSLVAQPSDSPGQTAGYSPFGIPVLGSNPNPTQTNGQLGNERHHLPYPPVPDVSQSRSFQPARFGPFAGGQYSMFGAMAATAVPAPGMGHELTQTGEGTEGSQNQNDVEGLDNDIVKSLML